MKDLEVSRDEAHSLSEMGQETYKLGRLDDIPREKLSLFTKMVNSKICVPGPMLVYTKKIKAFKLLNVAGSYHRGDSATNNCNEFMELLLPLKMNLGIL